MPKDRREEEVSDDEYETDSDCEYTLDEDISGALCRGFGCKHVDKKVLHELYVKQRGVCRVTGIPFETASAGAGLYTPLLTRRLLNQPASADNCMLVLAVVEKMRAATGLHWRTFTGLMQTVARDAEL